MGTNYNMQSGVSPAAGGMETPSEQRDARPIMPVYPDQIPSLSTPTQRPNEPVSDGLPIGAGRGPEALTNYDPRRSETQQLKRWLPLMEPFANHPETPDSVRMLIQYIRGS